jgi:hypothetical protein
MSLATLPDQILHLIRSYITPNQSAFNDDEKYQSPPLYHPIINFSIFAPLLNRILSAHTTLTDCCTRWDLLPRTLTVVLNREGLEEKKLEEGLMETVILAEPTLDGKVLAVCPEYAEKPALPQTPSLGDDAEVMAQKLEAGGDEEHANLTEEMDEGEDEEEDSDWSERDYEEDSEDSDWDSEDDSDYEDDWEAEYGFSLAKTEPVKQLPVPSSGLLAPGKSLLDF